MAFSIKIERDALKSLAKVTKKDRLRIIEAIDKLKETPELGNLLSGRWKGLRRMRVGDYRVIYGVKHKELLVLVVRLGHRREVYH